jgi:hypothetical protein
MDGDRLDSAVRFQATHGPEAIYPCCASIQSSAFW